MISQQFLEMNSLSELDLEKEEEKKFVSELSNELFDEKSKKKLNYFYSLIKHFISFKFYQYVNQLFLSNDIQNDLLKKISNFYDFNSVQLKYFISLLKESNNEINFDNFLFKTIKFYCYPTKNENKNGIIYQIKNNNNNKINFNKININQNIKIYCNPKNGWRTYPHDIPLEAVLTPQKFDGWI